MKKCANCKVVKDDVEFNSYKRKGKPFLNSTCKVCQLLIRRNKNKENPSLNEKRKLKAREAILTPEGKYKAIILSLNKLKIEHNFSYEEYLSLYDKTCDYCNSPRHLICPKNKGLGYISGNIQPVCLSCKTIKMKSANDIAFQNKMIRKYGGSPEKTEQLNSLVGQKFNKLTVKSIGDRARGHFYLNCICDCGRLVILREKLVINNIQKSCGCMSITRPSVNFLSKKHKEMLSEPRRKFNNLKSSSRHRNIINTLTYEEYESFYYKECFYCGELNDSKGVDRLDNNLGYEKDNIVSCCKICNSMKNTLSYTDFINKINKIVNNANNRSQI